MDWKYLQYYLAYQWDRVKKALVYYLREEDRNLVARVEQLCKQIPGPNNFGIAIVIMIALLHSLVFIHSELMSQYGIIGRTLYDNVLSEIVLAYVIWICLFLATAYVPRATYANGWHRNPWREKWEARVTCILIILFLAIIAVELTIWFILAVIVALLLCCDPPSARR